MTDFALERAEAASAPAQRIALLTQQVSHYHAARYRAAAREFRDVRVLSFVNSADFKEFLSAESAFTEVVRIYSGRDAYVRAVHSGNLWTRVHEELDRYAPSVVYIAGWSFPESVAAIGWAREKDARVVLMSASQPHDAARSVWREAVKRRVVTACDAAVVAAGPHGDYATHLGIPAERIFYGYDAVDNDYFAANADRARVRGAGLRARHGLPARYLLSSGRFIEKKNYPRLVEAFSRALAAGDHGHDLVILGDGPERGAIEEAVRRFGMERRVHLPGFKSYEELPDFYGLAEGFVHVALAEQWGLVINEAAAAAQPLVVSRPCGAATALVRHGENGYLIEPEDVDAISFAVARLMALSQQDRVTMGEASRRIVADWSPARFASGLRSAFEAALACPPRQLSVADDVLFRALAHVRFSKVQ